MELCPCTHGGFRRFDERSAAHPHARAVNDRIQTLLRGLLLWACSPCDLFIVIDSGLAQSTKMLWKAVGRDRKILGISANCDDARELAAVLGANNTICHTYGCALRRFRSQWSDHVRMLFLDMKGSFFGTERQRDPLHNLTSSRPRDDLRDTFAWSILASDSILAFTTSGSPSMTRLQLVRTVGSYIKYLGEKYGWITRFYDIHIKASSNVITFILYCHKKP
ncbi:hypothetical protein Pelo_6431 [Pelomyxa schiedti]|nr:hypothetical protein Pelo_6431 [Pelomyxa schiedti]